MPEHPEFDFDQAPGSPSGDPMRPSIGLAGFSADIFSPKTGVGLYGDDAALYKSLKRTKRVSGVFILLLSVLLVLVFTLYHSVGGGQVVMPEEVLAAAGSFNNQTALIDLDLDLSNNHGVCMPLADQAYFLFMNGILIASGHDNCGLEMVDKELHAPECRQNMHGQEMWVAIEAQDSEDLQHFGNSKGGLLAAMEWCGLEITTNENWRCSTKADEGWQNPLPPPADASDEDRAAWSTDSGDPMSSTWNEDANGGDLWGHPAATIPNHNVHSDASNMPALGSGPEYMGGEVAAKWIWMAGKSQAGATNIESADSVYCRRKISCHDPEFATQVEFTGYRCASAFVNQTEIQDEAVLCGEEVAKGESEVSHS